MNLEQLQLAAKTLARDAGIRQDAAELILILLLGWIDTVVER